MWRIEVAEWIVWGCTPCSEEPNAAKLITQLFTVQSDDDPKQTSEATQEIQEILNAMAMSVNSALPSFSVTKDKTEVIETHK